MTSRTCLASLFAGAICMLTLAAEARTPQSRPDDSRRAKEPRETKEARPLPGLEERAQKMLDMQIAVHNDTVALARAIKGVPKHRRASLKLSRSEKDMVVEATKTLDMLNEEGAALAFVEFFQQLRKDMRRVQRRLQVSKVGIKTQTIQTEIIDSLKEMIKSLKKR